MADLARTVQIIFNATDNTGGTISNIGSSIDAFADKSGSMLAPLDDLADKVKLANAAIVGLGVALGGAALIKAGEFGDQINEIGTLFGGTTDQISAFAGDVQTYAAGSTQSLNDINAAIYSSVSAGVEYGDSLAFLAESEKLAVAGKADLNSTSIALISTLNAYGESTDSASKYSDILFQTVKLGQTTLPELAGSLAQVTGIASAAGIPFADLSAAIAALTANGLPTTQAITGLKSAISNIIKPTSDAEKAAAELGVQFDAGALQSKGFAGVLDEVYEATNGNVGEMGRFFGSVEGLNVALSLGGDTAGKFAGALDGMANSSGATAAAFATMEENFAIAVQKMKNGVDLLLISIGGPLQDEFADLAGAFGDVFSNLKVSVDAGAFDPIFAVLGDVENDLTAFIQQMAANLPAALEKVDWTKFTAGIEALAAGLGGMFDGLDLGTPEGLAKAMQLAADAAGNLLAQGGGIAESWGDVISNVILPAIKAFAEMSTGASVTAGKILGMADALTALLPIIGGVGKGLESIGGALEIFAGLQVAKFVTGATSLSTALASIQGASVLAGAALAGATLTGGLVAAAGAAGYAVGTGLNAGIDALVEKLGGGKGGLGGLIYDLTNDTNGFATATDKSATSVSAANEAIRKWAESGSSSVKSTRELIASADETAARIDELGRLFKAGAAASEDWATKQVLAATKTGFMADAANAMAVATGKIKEETEIASDGMGTFTAKVGQSAAAMSVSAQAYLETARAAGTLEEAQKVVRAEYDKIHATFTNVGKSTTDYKGAMEGASSAAKGSAKDLIELAKVAGDYETKMAGIASNEKIKIIESKFKLNIAEVEAQTKVATALIESIGKTYEANTSLIGDLMDSVSAANTFSDRTKTALANQANMRANDLHRAQMDLIQKNSEYLAAKTRAAQNGNPLITVQADGLKPHLEAFMWEILSAIQVKMAYEGGDMLVGGCTL